MTVYSGTVESTKIPGITRHFRYMKFLKEKSLKEIFSSYVAKSPIGYDFIREFKMGPLVLYVAAKPSVLGVELLAIHDDKDDKDLGVLTTIASTDTEAEAILKEFMKIARVKEEDIPLEELEKTVMENIDFYKKF